MRSKNFEYKRYNMWCQRISKKRERAEQDIYLLSALLGFFDLERDVCLAGDLERDVCFAGDLERDVCFAGDLERDVCLAGDLPSVI